MDALLRTTVEVQARLDRSGIGDRACIEHWLRQFEQALEDSPLVETFRSLR